MNKQEPDKQETKKLEKIKLVVSFIFDIEQAIAHMFDVSPEFKHPATLHDLLPIYEYLKFIQGELASACGVVFDEDENKSMIIESEESKKLEDYQYNISRECKENCARWRRRGFVWDLGTDEGQKAFYKSKRKFVKLISKQK